MQLSEYHYQFLHALIEFEVKFLVIGGQARSHHFGNYSKDLDVWAQAGIADRNLEDLLIFWVKQFPMHVSRPMDFRKPLAIREGVQVHFPEMDVNFRMPDGTWATIEARNGIDVLTSLPPLNFGDCLNRAATAAVQDLVVPLLSKADLEAERLYRNQDD